MVYGNFFFKKIMIFSINVKEAFYAKDKKQIIFCKISKPRFDHEV